MDDPKGRNFDLFVINVDGSGLERITDNDTFDGFPMFSPDGKKLVFASNRNAKTRGDTNVFIADWVDKAEIVAASHQAEEEYLKTQTKNAGVRTNPQPGRTEMKAKLFLRTSFLLTLMLATCAWVPAQQPTAPSAERLRAHITYLASDALSGRRTGTPGAAGAAQYIAGEFSRSGLRPGTQSARAPRSEAKHNPGIYSNSPMCLGWSLATAICSLIQSQKVPECLRKHRGPH